MAKSIATLGIKVDPKGAVSGANRAKGAIRGVGNAALKVKNQIFSLNGALGALGVGMAARSALKYASSIEGLRVRLKFLTGSTKDAGKAFDTMLGFAKQAPFTLQEIQKASPSLLTVTDDVEELGNLLKITGDIAATSGLSFEQTAQQIQRTFAGGIAAADLFRESGVKAMLGFEEGVKYSAAESKKHIISAFSEGSTAMKGATSEMANTFDGQVSMMGDAWDELQKSFMDEGVFDEIKKNVIELTAHLKDPKTIEATKELARSTLEVAAAIKTSIGHFNDLPEWVKTVGIVGAVLGGKTGKVIMGGLLYAGEEVGEMLDNVKASWEEYLQTRDKDTFGEPPKRPKVDGTPFGFDKINLEQPKPIMIDLIAQGEENAAKAIKNTLKLTSTTEKYKESIINVGVELTKRQKAEKAYEAETARIRAYVKDKGLSAIIEAQAIGEVTDAYESAIARMDELDIAKKVAGIADSMETSITDMILNIGNGANSLKDTVKDMARAILAEFIKIQVARPMANMLAGFTSGMFRADGGTVTGNQPYVVGEQGAELFVPNKTGTIIPNDAMSSGGSRSETNNVNVSFNITANDTQGFDNLLDSRRGMIVGIINQAMNDRGITGVTA
jgi:hypothetical protein